MKPVINFLSICAVLLTFLPDVQAQENPDLNPLKGETTLSGESLKTVQDRSIDVDYFKFIAQPTDLAKLREWGQVNAKGSFSDQLSVDILSTFLGWEDISNTLTFSYSPSSGSQMGIVLTHD